MKNKLVFILIMFLGVTAIAQTKPGREQSPGKDRMESAKIGFITRELQLTPDEAKAFWPIYNAMEAEMKQANRDPLDDGLKTVRGKGGIDKLTDAQAKELLAELDKLGAERDAIRRKYQKEFLKILSPQKVLKLHLAERKFKQEVLERLREARGGHPGPPPGGGRPPRGLINPNISSSFHPFFRYSEFEIASVKVDQNESKSSATSKAVHFIQRSHLSPVGRFRVITNFAKQLRD